MAPGAGPDGEEPWPELPWRAWEPTIAALHMCSQIVGKVRLALAPPLNHWWHVTLQVTPRGLTTGAIPYERRSFRVDFDFVDHRLRIDESDGRSFAMALEPTSVAEFYGQFLDGLRSLAIEVAIWPRPVEVAESIPFGSDERPVAYDTRHAHLLWRALLHADRVMRAFQSGFVGKASPVQFFWGSFDLATTRFSGRPAPRHRGGSPNCPTWVMEEAYSREEISVGWWPSSEPPGPAFYAYAYPEPAGFRSTPVHASAVYDEHLGLFMLPYDAARQAGDPDDAALEFFRSTYASGADLGRWDRAALEPAGPPGHPPTRPWSLLATGATGASARGEPHCHGGRHARGRDTA